LVWHGIFRVIARKAPSASGTEVGPVPAVPDEPARLGEDAALSLPEVHSTELHRSGGVEEPAVTRVQDGEAGPLECRVEAEGRRAAGRVPGAQEVAGVAEGECAVAGAHQRLSGRRLRACVESPAARLIVVPEAAGTRGSVHAGIFARAHR